MHKKNISPWLSFLRAGFSLSTLSILFWLLAIGLTVFVYFFSSYLIQQQQERVVAGASISAKGLANVIDERLAQQRLMVKALAFHNAERIKSLSQGQGNASDLVEITGYIRGLLPNATQFAVLDGQGTTMVGSEQLHIGMACQTDIQRHLVSLSPKVSFFGPHNSPDGSIHYDVAYPLGDKEHRSVLFLSFKFDMYQSLIAHFDTDEFEFILVRSAVPYKVIASAKGVAESRYGAVLDQKVFDNSLIQSRVLNGKWTLLGVTKGGVFSNYTHRVCWAATVFLSSFLLLMVILFRSLYRIEQTRKRLENNSVQDALFNTGPTVLFQKKADNQMAVEYVSPNVHALLGCGVQEVLNKDSFTDIILLEDIAAVQVAILNACTHHEKEVSLEYRVRYAKYQGYRWVYDLTRIVYDAQGKPLHLQSYVTSIHAQKMAEQRANRLIESAPDALAITDRYGVVLRVNQAFEKMFGYEREDLVGLSLDLCIYETSQEGWHQRIEQLLKKEGSYSLLLGVDTVVTAITREGKTFAVEVGFSRVDSVEDVQLVYMIRDISIQIKAQQQMQIAKERAEALAKARSRFVATMSHEIRTPLNGVLGMSNLLRNTPLNAQQSMYLQAIEHSGQSLLKVVNNILDFAKLDEGGVNLEFKAFDLNTVVQDALQIVQVQAQEEEVQLFFESDLPSQLQLVGDAGRVQQVLLNLLSNAIKFSPQGTVEVLVKAQALENSTSDLMQVLIEVKDTGIGIAKESLEQLFDSFTQADDSTTRKFGGTGLGLAISKQLVELMGGGIGVVSEQNKGSLFWVELPFQYRSPVPCLEDKTQPKKVQEGIQKVSEAVLANKIILLIEDNETNQEIVLAFVQRLGGRIDIAKNGLEGLSFWRMDAKKYDLILMDCQMPVMDGYEATILIRKEEALSHQHQPIPIVALTANAMPEDRERCFSVGMDDYITKPIDIELFNQTLIKWLKG